MKELRGFRGDRSREGMGREEKTSSRKSFKVSKIDREDASQIHKINLLHQQDRRVQYGKVGTETSLSLKSVIALCIQFISHAKKIINKSGNTNIWSSNIKFNINISSPCINICVTNKATVCWL